MRYNTSADMWSLACIVFELLTGDLLFDPRSGDDYDRDEDHLAQCVELLGRLPRRLTTEGRYSRQYFNRKGELRHIRSLKFWGLEDVLVDKYHFSRKDACEAASFMLPMLEMDPAKRATAQQMLSNPWIAQPAAATAAAATAAAPLEADLPSAPGDSKCSSVSISPPVAPQPAKGASTHGGGRVRVIPAELDESALAAFSMCESPPLDRNRATATDSVTPPKHKGSLSPGL
jgi:serine/threonine protein kinase